MSEKLELLKKEIPIEYTVHKSDDGGDYIEGYANTKNNEDRVGDIPTNLNGADVYVLKHFKRNPVALIDHQNSVGNIAGTFTQISEDANGLKFKLKFMKDPQTDIAKHAKNAYLEGHGRALSIGYSNPIYGDPENKQHLTSVDIHEISLVGVGADPMALTTSTIPKSLTSKDSKELSSDDLTKLIKGIREVKQEMKKLLK